MISDGGETGGAHGTGPVETGPPVFAVGIGSHRRWTADREVIGISAGDPRLDQASVDLHVSAVARGFGRERFDLRVLGNGRLLDSRTLTPAADGSPIDEIFTVSPDPLNPTVYTAEIAAGLGRGCRREQRAQRARQPGRPEAPHARIAGAPGLRAQFPDARAGGRSRPRSRLRRAQGQERGRPGHVLRPGGRGPGSSR